MTRFYQLQAGTRFRTGKVEVKGGTVHREFFKADEVFEWFSPAYGMLDGQLGTKPIKFHPLTPVWPI